MVKGSDAKPPTGHSDPTLARRVLRTCDGDACAAPPTRSLLEIGLGRASDFRWPGGKLLYGLTDAQCCFDALN